MRLYLNGAVFNELSPELTLFEKFIGTLDGRGAAVVASHLSELRTSEFDRNVVLFQLLILPVYPFPFHSLGSTCETFADGAMSDGMVCGWQSSMLYYPDRVVPLYTDLGCVLVRENDDVIV
jgi:hypothetical protein